MADNPLNGNGESKKSHPFPATVRPGDFPLGSLQSRAAARAMLLEREKPRLTQYDQDALTIYSNVSASYSPRCGWHAQPNGWDLQGNPVYERGWELRQKCHPIIPAHLDEHLKRWTRESGQFELAFGREPECGDILRYEQVARINDSRLIETHCYVFTEAWNRQLPELPCPKKFEGGRLFIRSVRRVQSQQEEAWVDNIDVQPKAIWREFERYIKWLALGRPNGLRLGPLALPLEDIPTIPALTFFGVGPREEVGGFIENKHRCRPSTEKELQGPDPEPIDGLLKALGDAGVDEQAQPEAKAAQ
jgi:hypothetical protein